jgi:hypothetical protein
MGTRSRKIGARLWRGQGGKASRLAILLLALIIRPAWAAGETPVAVQLVLALDSSASVDGGEFRLQIAGLAAAFADPEVLREVETLKPLGAAVAVVEWGGPGESRVVLPFTPILTSRDAKAFGFRISLIRRWMRASETSIATGIDDSRALIEASEYGGLRKVIDVSGDGVDNGGADLESARAKARAQDITVNGLPIMADDPKLDIYYRDQVIVGAASFIEPARDFEDYVRAIKEKLLRELRPMES